MEYRCNIKSSREECNGHEFAVKFIGAGDFPDNGPVHDIVNGGNFAIIAATDRFGAAWSYVNLNSEEKDCVGDAMEKFECVEDIWYWCELFKN